MLVFGDNELNCSKSYDRKAKLAFRTSKCCNRQVPGRTEGKFQMLVSPRNNGLTSLFKEVRPFFNVGSDCISVTLHIVPTVSGTFKRGVTERGVFAFACQYIASPRCRTGNRTVTQMRHPLIVEGQPNCARQSLASTLSAPRVAATPYCDPARHANVITPCLLTPCLNVP